MKTILIPITSSYFVRSFLRADTFPALRADPQVMLVFLAEQGKIDYYTREFAAERVRFLPLPNATSLLERFFAFLETSSIHSRTAAMMQRFEYHRIGSQRGKPFRFFVFLVRRMLWHLGRFAAWRQGIRRVYSWIPSKTYREIISQVKPDLVYCPTMLARDMAILKEAKRAGVRTMGMVLSWDNLFSKTILRVHPDRLLVHTENIKRQAVAFGDYPASHVVVTGIPQYDRHCTKAGLLPRDTFIRSLGGDPAKKLIVYAISGKTGLPIDLDVIDILGEEIKKGALREAVEVLVRPYPRSDFSKEKLERIKTRYGFLGESSMAHIGKGRDNWEFDEGAILLLLNTLAHADVVITMYSTFFIEGALHNKPLIGISFDGRKKFDKENSAERFFQWDHLAEIEPLGGIHLVRSIEELVVTLNGYLENPRKDEEGRRRMVRQQCGFTDGRSGERVAHAILSYIS